MEPLQLRVEGDTQVVITRRFAAPPEAVFRAHIDADLMKQWMTGPDGWSMLECESDARPGGKIRCVWAHPEQDGFFLTGEYVAVEPHHRLEHIERMHFPDPTPDNHIVTTFAADGEGTMMTMVMTLPSKEVREAMLATGMDAGMEASYQRLETTI